MTQTNLLGMNLNSEEGLRLKRKILFNELLRNLKRLDSRKAELVKSYKQTVEEIDKKIALVRAENKNETRNKNK